MIMSHHHRRDLYAHQDSKLGVEVEIIGSGPIPLKFGAGNSKKLSMSSSSETSPRTKRDMPTSRRAKHHLKHHGIDGFGRDYSFFPKMLNFHEASDLFGESYAGKSSCSKRSNGITHWMMEPLNMTEEYLIHLMTVAVGISIQDTLHNGGILFGINEGGILKAGLIFCEVRPSKDSRSRPLKRFADLYALVHIKSAGMPASVDHRQRSHVVGAYVDRAQQLEDSFTEWHRCYCYDKPHWYLTDLAVGSEHQGKGYAKELISTLAKLADRYLMDIYLECSTNVTGFFSKFGFEQIDVNQTIAATKEDFSKLEVSLMIRKAHSEYVRV